MISWFALISVPRFPEELKQSLAEGLSAGHLFDLFATSFRTVAKLVAIKSPEAMADNEDFRLNSDF